MDSVSGIPGKVLATQDLGWGLLICTTEGAYVLEKGEIKPLGRPAGKPVTEKK